VRRRQAVFHVREHHGHSERRICRALHITRSSVRYVPQPRDDEAALTQAVIRLAGQYGRYGYRRIHALVMAEGWQVSRSRVERIWKREGLKVPKKQPREVGYGWPMAAVYAFDRSTPTTSGAGISSWNAPMAAVF
jgi:HTH-like domain